MYIHVYIRIYMYVYIHMYIYIYIYISPGPKDAFLNGAIWLCFVRDCIEVTRRSAVLT
jgi:hypothetical protein